MADIEKIEKLIRLTNSDNDNEALLALRNAQRLAGGDLLAVLRGNKPTSQSRHADGTGNDKTAEQGKRFLELLQRIRMKDATIEKLREEIRKLKEQNQAK
jgi:hypothetical protein